MADFEGDDQVKSLIFQSTRKNASSLVEMRGPSVFDEIPFPRYDIFPYFQPFYALFNSEWLTLSVILKSRFLNISTPNRNDI